MNPAAPIIKPDQSFKSLARARSPSPIHDSPVPATPYKLASSASAHPLNLAHAARYPAALPPLTSSAGPRLAPDSDIFGASIPVSTPEPVRTSVRSVYTRARVELIRLVGDGDGL